MANVRGTAPAGASLRLVRADGSTSAIEIKPGAASTFYSADVPDGWYVLSAWMPGFRETVQAVRLPGAGPVDVNLVPMPNVAPGPIPVLTVCEALDQRDSLTGRPAIITGVFKSGTDETLRLDCPAELLSGGIGWPSSIGLNNVSQPPDNLRPEIEEKRQEILKGAPPEAPLRPERVMGLYGRFVSLAGLSMAKCCGSSVQTNLPPARLFGLDEKDMRVIR